MLISENARALFAGRLKQVLHLIEHSGIEYEEIGIFGSYARGDCKTTSDIDFLVIVPERPDRCLSGELREQANELKADIVYMTRDYFNHDNHQFTKSVRRDYQCLKSRMTTIPSQSTTTSS